MEQELKTWRCPNGHVMGVVVRNGSGVRRLLLYRQALVGPVDASPQNGEVEVDVIAVVEGYAADVRCSVCGAVRTWVPGEEAMKQLLKAAGRMHA